MYKNRPSFIWPLPIGPIIVERSDPELERSRFSTSPTRDRSFESLSLENVRHSLKKSLKKICFHRKLQKTFQRQWLYRQLQDHILCRSCLRRDNPLLNERLGGTRIEHSSHDPMQPPSQTLGFNELKSYFLFELDIQFYKLIILSLATVSRLSKFFHHSSSRPLSTINLNQGVTFSNLTKCTKSSWFSHLILSLGDVFGKIRWKTLKILKFPYFTLIFEISSWFIFNSWFVLETTQWSNSFSEKISEQSDE